MTEFKFSCPSCKQNFKVDTSICGKKIECPSCHAKIIAPEKPDKPDTVPVATLETPPPAKPPAEAPAKKAAPAESKPAETPAEPKKAPDTPPRPQIPILTAPIKQEIVQAVKSLLSDKSKWMPRINENGDLMYAAKKEGDKLVPVAVESSEATHFSLLGAVLHEFHVRNVMRTAAGRKRFLDKAIPEAISAVIKKDTGKSPEDLGKVALTHEQTIKVIGILENKFDDEADLMAQAMERTSKMGKTRVQDIVMKIEGESIITNEEIATALCNELEEIKARLATLEAKVGVESPKKDADNKE